MDKPKILVIGEGRGLGKAISTALSDKPKMLVVGPDYDINEVQEALNDGVSVHFQEPMHEIPERPKLTLLESIIARPTSSLVLDAQREGRLKRFAKAGRKAGKNKIFGK